MPTTTPKRRTAYKLSFSSAVRREAIAAIYLLSNETETFETLKSVVVFGCKHVVATKRRDLLIGFMKQNAGWHIGKESTYLMLNDAEANILRAAHKKIEEIINSQILQPEVIAYAIHIARTTLQKRVKVHTGHA